ncbi:MAG: biotin--[acetyl-CoA-carboxylase] ligase [Pseudomonadota bacterium]
MNWNINLPLRPKNIKEMLGQSIFAQNLIYYESTASTNTLAKKLAEEGAPEGTLVLTEYQTAGKGRKGRRWLSQRYLNLLFSILLMPSLPPNQMFVLTMILALAAMDGIKESSGLQTWIKWPNDLYVGHKKLGGILTEISIKGKKVDYVVLGLGLNVNWNPGKEQDLLYPSTSILAETGIVSPREHLLIGIVKLFEEYYLDILRGEIEDYHRRWNQYSMIIGRSVEIISDQETVRGIVLLIDREGALIIRDEEGKEQKVFSGDLSVVLEGKDEGAGYGQAS